METQNSRIEIHRYTLGLESFCNQLDGCFCLFADGIGVLFHKLHDILNVAVIFAIALLLGDVCLYAIVAVHIVKVANNIAYDAITTVAEIYAFLDFICEMPMDDVNKRRALINIFVHSVYLYDDYFTIIINASKNPLSIDNIPLDEIEEAFEGENEGKGGVRL